MFDSSYRDLEDDSAMPCFHSTLEVSFSTKQKCYWWITRHLLSPHCTAWTDSTALLPSPSVFSAAHSPHVSLPPFTFSALPAVFWLIPSFSAVWPLSPYQVSPSPLPSPALPIVARTPSSSCPVCSELSIRSSRDAPLPATIWSDWCLVPKRGGLRLLDSFHLSFLFLLQTIISVYDLKHLSLHSSVWIWSCSSWVSLVGETFASHFVCLT